MLKIDALHKVVDSIYDNTGPKRAAEDGDGGDAKKPRPAMPLVENAAYDKEHDDYHRNTGRYQAAFDVFSSLEFRPPLNNGAREIEAEVKLVREWDDARRQWANNGFFRSSARREWKIQPAREPEPESYMSDQLRRMLSDSYFAYLCKNLDEQIKKTWETYTKWV